jgi:uncharacterized protein
VSKLVKNSTGEAGKQAKRICSLPFKTEGIFMMNPVQTKEELENRLHTHREAIRHFGVKRLGLFGSFRRNAQSEQSDVDFLVEFLPGKKTFRNFMGLAFFLEDLLQRRVELVTPESLGPYMKAAILSEVESVEAVS